IEIGKGDSSIEIERQDQRIAPWRDEDHFGIRPLLPFVTVEVEFRPVPGKPQVMPRMEPYGVKYQQAAPLMFPLIAILLKRHQRGRLTRYAGGQKRDHLPLPARGGKL